MNGKVNHEISVKKNSPAPMLDHNEYSVQAMLHLLPLPQTEGADLLLDEARLHNRRRRVSGDKDVDKLVTTQMVNNGQVIMEMHGYVGMEKEKREGSTVFMYEGLAGRTISIDTRETEAPQRSCCPNSVLKHVLGSRTLLGIMVVAIKDIPNNTEVTLPFNSNWKDSDVPIECAEHQKNILECPFEKERLKAAARRVPKKVSKDQRRLEEDSELEKYLINQLSEIIDVNSTKQDFQLPRELFDISRCAPWVRETAAKRNSTCHDDNDSQFDVAHQEKEQKFHIPEAEDVPTASKTPGPTPFVKTPADIASVVPEAPKTEIPDRRSKLLHLIRQSLKNVDFKLPNELENVSKCAPWVRKAEKKMLETKKKAVTTPENSVSSVKMTPLADRCLKKRKESNVIEKNEQGAKRRRI
ncbi:hypothetical protein GCK72_007965 [Caenorhabditis remanei]|uniref:SET domain-containing protein n=1 Tax=Caenorhabditis remanei TaxID=31234 RepID=A0A6A5HN27_CAERE|nr:hypothetical protein GCK72_007965 [Caenorhabditis remanei]KAF1768004.1 hypothetical protein GCK72_007965 [Caenorhabditis remanei]